MSEPTSLTVPKPRAKALRKYTFTLRWANDAYDLATGYVCVNDRGRIVPFSLQAYGGIPSRLNKGATDVEQGENVSRQAWQNLHTGGMGANEAKDFSVYRYPVGAYCGDEDEITLGPARQEIVPIVAAPVLLKVGERIRQLLHYFVPKTNLPGEVQNITVQTRINEKTPNANTEHGMLKGNVIYQYRVTATTIGGEGPIHSSGTATVGAANGQGGTYINWDPIPNALVYTVYGRTAEANDLLIGYVAGNVVKKNSKGDNYRFHDDGSLQTPTIKYSVVNQPKVNADYRHELIFASNFSAGDYYTYVYEVTYSGLVSHVDMQQSLGGQIVRMLMWDTTSGTPAQAYRLPGVMRSRQERTACIFRNRIYLPLLQSDGSYRLFILYPDDTDGHDTLHIAENTTLSGHLVVSDLERRLWLFNRNLAFWSNDPSGTQSPWNGPIVVGDNETHIVSGLVYGGTQTADSALYMGKAEGLFRILDTEGGPATRAERVTTLGLSTEENNGRVLVEHRGELYISSGSELFRYNLGQIDSTTPNKNQGLPVSLQGLPLAGASTGRHLYTLVGPVSNFNLTATPPLVYGYQQILETTHGEAWHQVHLSNNEKAGTNFPDPFHPGDAYPRSDFREVYAESPDRWIGQTVNVLPPLHTHGTWACLLFSGGEDGNKLYRLPIRIGNERLRETMLPVDATHYGYVPRLQARLKLPPFYGASRNIEKAWHWFQISKAQGMDPLVTDCILYSYGRFRWIVDTNTLFDEIGHGTIGGTLPARQEFINAPWRIYRPNSNPALEEFLDNQFRPSRYVADGIELDILFNAGGTVDSTTGVRHLPVLRDPMIAFSPSNQSLRTWVFNVTIGYQQPLMDGSLDNLTIDDLKAKRQKLTDFSTNTGVIIVNDADGNEIYVRLDMGFIRPTKRDVRIDKSPELIDGTVGSPTYGQIIEPDVITENLSYDIQVTLTELYPVDAYRHT